MTDSTGPWIGEVADHAVPKKEKEDVVLHVSPFLHQILRVKTENNSPDKYIDVKIIYRFTLLNR